MSDRLERLHITKTRKASSFSVLGGKIEDRPSPDDLPQTSEPPARTSTTLPSRTDTNLPNQPRRVPPRPSQETVNPRQENVNPNQSPDTRRSLGGDRGDGGKLGTKIQSGTSLEAAHTEMGPLSTQQGINPLGTTEGSHLQNPPGNRPKSGGSGKRPDLLR